MDKQLKEILNTLYEAEGLLEMALRRGPDSYAALAALARHKCYHAADLAAALDLPAAEAELPQDSEAEDDAEKIFVEKIVPQLDAELAESTEEEAEQMAEATPEPEPERPPVDEPAPKEPDSAPIEEEEEMEAEAMRTLPADKPGERAIADASIFEVEEDADDGLPEETEVEEDSEDSEEPESPSKPRRQRKPIATFFSINDKFRFRRELFANNNREWLDALALLEAMDDLEEARDYLFDDLQWEDDNADVKAFVDVLARYYRS